MTRVVHVADHTGRVLVTRDDTDHAVRRLTAAHGHRCPTRFAEAATALYREFGRRVRTELVSALPHPAGVRVDDWDAGALRRAVVASAGPGPLVSLDPLLDAVGSALRVSRGFRPRGVHQVGLVPRPGAPSLSAQLVRLGAGGARAGCTLVEDDVYTGGTLAAVARLLAGAGIAVAGAACGIRVRVEGAPDTPVPLRSTVEYRVPLGRPDLVQVADPRSFLFGVDGLVVRVGADGWGRAPYWDPFVSAAARLGVAAERERRFATAMIAANTAFYRGLAETTGVVVALADLPNAAPVGALDPTPDPGTPVVDYLAAVVDDLDRATERVAALDRGGVSQAVAG
ncbi:hypothetical protein [Saccharothrix lopnurensis]|uniref:Phosphoribosyl transferase-like protein n=1 Tax=Saccharothrix lopnurensis TaxID=1670621 RepID=A0ABW1PDP5_9PSEU